MLKSLKMLLVVALLTGIFSISLAYYVNAGGGCTIYSPGASECVDCCKEDCYFGQYKHCVDSCSSFSGKYKGKCIAECNLEVACCFDNCLFYDCSLGADSHPAFCQNGG